MSTVENFLLLMTDPTSGKTQLDWSRTEPVLGGAILFDLVASGKLALDGQGRKAKVIVTDRQPTGDPILDAAFTRVANKGRQSPQGVVGKLGKKALKTTYAALSNRGIVRARDAKALGIFPLARHDIIEPARRDDLLTRVRACLLHDQTADPETGPLIGLLSAADLTKLVVDKPDRKLAKARAKVIADGDWASEGVRKAIQAAQSAMTTAIVAASIATSAGSS